MFNPTALEQTIISGLWHTSRIALAGGDNSRYARKVWASKEFAKTEHALKHGISVNAAYKMIDRQIGSI